MLSPLQTSKEAVNAITGIAINTPDSPLRESFQQKIADSVTHESLNLSFYVERMYSWKVH
jgi:hypothetical protein